MKILLLGKNGQVGWELQRSLAPLAELIALDRHSPNLCGDLSKLQALLETVEMVKPDVIVNAAAYTAVDKAEREPEFAHLINAAAPGMLAQAAHRLGAWLVHFSTDYVFDGSGTRPWLETDSPAPRSVYGQTKLEGERLIAEYCRKYLIFRASWVYAARGDNFARTILRLAQERDRLTVVDDQWGAPTGAELLADVSAHVLRQILQGPQNAGIYHVAASGETTWHGYAAYVLAQAGQSQLAIKVVAKDVAPVPSSAFPTLARRPHNSRLNTSKLQTNFGLRLPPWQQGVDRMLLEVST
jgi:dTDP-4-dehydrorhamnose reductase